MELLEAIERRKSVRKYKEEKLLEKDYRWLKEEIAQINEKQKSKLRMVLIEAQAVKESKIGSLFGMVKINAPYEIVLIGKKEERLMAGCEGERLVLKLTQRQIGTCWLGTYSKEVLQSLCKVSKEEEIFCVIALGIPYDGGFLNNTFRQMIGCQKRKPLEEIIRGTQTISSLQLKEKKNLQDTRVIENAKAIEDTKVIQDALEAAIKAPSANNLQPWQVEVDGNGLKLFFKSPYELDGGIFLAHLLAVLDEKKISYHWQSIKEESQKDWVNCGRIDF